MDPFVGEIRIFSFGFAPVGWALCNGAAMPVAQNQALYALIGAYFGTSGGVPPTSFNLPDLRGRTPLHMNPTATGYAMGNAGGAEGVALTLQNIPPHTHQVVGTLTTGVANPTNTIFAGAGVNVTQGGAAAIQQNIYAAPGALVGLNADAVSKDGGNAQHSNMQPFSVTNFCIATLGVWPSRG